METTGENGSYGHGKVVLSCNYQLKNETVAHHVEDLNRNISV